MDELEKQMYFGAKPETIGKAKELRKNMTLAENLLWEKLKGKQLLGLRIRRQHPIGIFIADFYCHKAGLVIEIDGKIHDFQKEYDQGRTDAIAEHGIKVIRFTNEEVINGMNAVIDQITQIITKKLKSPSRDLGENGVIAFAPPQSPKGGDPARNREGQLNNKL